MKLYAFFQPYIDDRHDELQEIAQYQVFFTLFIALLIRTSESLLAVSLSQSSLSQSSLSDPHQ